MKLISSFNKRLGLLMYWMGNVVLGCVGYAMSDGPVIILISVLMIFVMHTLQWLLLSFITVDSNCFAIESIFRRKRRYDIGELREVKSLDFIGLFKIGFKNGDTFYFFGQSLKRIKKIMKHQVVDQLEG